MLTFFWECFMGWMKLLASSWVGITLHFYLLETWNWGYLLGTYLKA
jgi:hypothetical protein